MTLAVRAGACSAKGPYRKINEDRFFTDPAGRLFVVADGMGGRRAGEVASELAVTVLSHDLAPEALRGVDLARQEPVAELLRHAFLDASARIVAASHDDVRFFRMGTTAVVAFWAGKQLFIAGWGDSRAYLVHKGRIVQMTRDDTVAQQLVAAGIVAPEDAATHPWRHALSQYLGCERAVDGPQVRVLSPEPGDCLLLATDGLTDVLDGSAMLGILESDADPQAASEALVAAALERDSHDNVTCLTMRFADLPQPADIEDGAAPPALPCGRPAQSRVVVQVEGGPSDGAAVSVDELPVVVGRGPSAGLVIADPHMSRLHCELLNIEGLLAVRDLESTNGTFVNGRRVTRVLLKPGDRLQVGRTTVVVMAAAEDLCYEPSAEDAAGKRKCRCRGS